MSISFDSTPIRLGAAHIRGLAEFVAALPAPAVARALAEAAALVAPSPLADDP